MALPTPQGRQKEVLYLDDEGHFVILGTAGSGKTTLAILRAAWLSKETTNKGRTLLVTYNKVLATYLEQLVPEGHGDLEVRNYHRFARGYLGGRGKLPDNCILNGGDQRTMVSEALIGLRKANPENKLLANSDEVLADEIVWMERMGIGTQEQYVNVQRVQRGGLRVAGPDRLLMWKLRLEYIKLRKNAGKLYDWDDLATMVRIELAADKSERYYRHVVIDEGQDFSPEMIRSLAEAVPKKGSVTFFGDMAQQIYGGRISWSQAGLNLGGRSVIHFQENYRNTKEIAAFALGLTRGPNFSGIAVMVKPKAPTAEGVLPTLVSFKESADEFSFVVASAVARAKTQPVGILLRVGANRNAYIRAISKTKTPVESLDRNQVILPRKPGVWVGTIHSAKGLEFEAVFLPELNDKRLPLPIRRAEFHDEIAWLVEEAKLFYVVHHWTPFLTIMLTVGLRPGEACGLKWSDLSGNKLRVQRALSRYPGGKCELLPPKTKRSRRVVTLPEMAVRALKRQKADQAEARLLLGAEYNTELDLVFATHSGQPLDTGNFNYKVFKPLLKRAGLPPLRLYDLRHSAATILLAAGEHPKIVAERLGHSTTTLTMDTYSHVLPDMQDAAAGRLDTLLAVNN
jgi:integrase